MAPISCDFPISLSKTDATVREPRRRRCIGQRMLTNAELLRKMADRCRTIAPTRLTEEGQAILLRMADDYEHQALAQGLGDPVEGRAVLALAAA